MGGEQAAEDAFGSYYTFDAASAFKQDLGGTHCLATYTAGEAAGEETERIRRNFGCCRRGSTR